MPGMGGSPLQLTNPLVVDLFRHALFVTSALWIVGLGLAILVTSLFLGRAYNFNLSADGLNEPRSRTYLRWAFGALWLIDGFLQFQPSMPLGLANGVVAPAAVGTPTWLHTLMFTAIGVWNNHPVALATATAWIEIGIGVILLVSNGRVGRFGAAVSVGWAGMVWLIGNGAGGIFSPTSSILFGWPGATLFYVAAGAWLVADNRRFSSSFSRYTTRGVSVILVVGAVIQSLPNREFWHGGNTNAMTVMSTFMTRTPQPHWLSWIVDKSGTIAGTMGGGFNVVVILWLLVCAVGLWLSTTRRLRWPIITLVIGCLVFWLIGEDAAIFGGLATDVNSLIALALLAACATPHERGATPRARRLPKDMRSSTGAVAASFAGAAIVFSSVSSGWSSVASAENTFYLAQNGSASAVNGPASPFTLTDQSGRPYTLGEHRGRFTLLTFLDPVCDTDCPLLANQLRSVRAALGPRAPIDIVAVAADPFHETLANVNAFIQQRGLRDVKNFYFVTSDHVKTAEMVWAAYGISVVMKPSDEMSVHSDFMFIIDPNHYLKWVIPDNPLTNWAGQHSAETELLNLLHQVGVR
jgi:cytochrome oxidase Cu insertion factor (SCO1/SenC/PrrC family)